MKINQETVINIKNLVDPESVLGYLGFNIVKRGPKELRGPCKVHGGDNFTAFRFNLENRTWCCYTRHCEGDKDRDLIGLVRKATGKNFIESVQLLADMAGVDLNNQEQLSTEFFKLKQKQEMRKEMLRNKRSPVARVVSEGILSEFEGKRSGYFDDRGFPKEILDFYEVGGTADSRGIHRDTIPIRNEDGELLTVSMRRTDSDEDPKYILFEDVPKGDTLYNIHIAKHYVGENRTLIIVEGFVDVWALCALGVYNVVAIMGTDVVPKQASLVWKYAENATIMLDPDKAGREGTPRVIKALEKGLNLQAVFLPDGKDPKYFNKEDLEIYFGGI
jgi:DNA primase